MISLYLSLSLSVSLSSLCQARPSFRCVLRATSVAAREQALPLSGPSARGGPPARRSVEPAAAVIIIFCSHGAFSPIFPCRRRRLRRRLVRERAGRPTRRRRALSPAPLARTRNSLCCLHIFNTISLAVGRIFGSSLSEKCIGESPCPIIKISR